MTKTTEELKRAMYDQFARTVKALQTTHNKNYKLSRLETALEAYLEALRQDARAEELRLTETIRYNAVLSDAYSHQQALTHAACVSERETWTQIHELKAEIKRLQDANDRGNAASLQDQATIQNLKNANDHGCRVLVQLQEERDELRNKLQAFEFANKSSGEFLQESNRLLKEAREDKKRMRQSIGQLKNDRNNAQANETRLRLDNARLRQELAALRKERVATLAQSSPENVAGDELKRSMVWKRVPAGPDFDCGSSTCVKCGDRSGVLK